MKRFVVLDKKTGETPLVAIQTWKSSNLDYVDMPACYAGRLDPMASGKLLILLGDECKRQREYTNLDKEYEVEILLDIGSDTGDALGLVEYSDTETQSSLSAVKKALYKEIGNHIREYPIFSSKTVNGKPLFLYALEGKIESIKIPVHSEYIYKIKALNIQTVSLAELKERVVNFLNLVPTTTQPSKKLGEDFRIDSVRSSWEFIFNKTSVRKFTVIRVKVICGSGTYMRSLASRIGKSLGTKAFALSINRTKIGKYISLFKDIGVWVRKY